MEILNIDYFSFLLGIQSEINQSWAKKKDFLQHIVIIIIILAKIYTWPSHSYIKNISMSMEKWTHIFSQNR